MTDWQVIDRLSCRKDGLMDNSLPVFDWMKMERERLVEEQRQTDRWMALYDLPYAGGSNEREKQAAKLEFLAAQLAKAAKELRG